MNEQKLGYVYRHLTKPPEGFIAPWSYQELMSPRIVQDRFHMSEIVYAKMRGDQPLLTPLKYEMIDAWHVFTGGITVILIGDPDLLKHRWRSKDRDEMYTLDKTLKVNDMFAEIVEEEHISVGEMVFRPKFTYGFSVVDAELPKSLVDDIVEIYVNRLREFNSCDRDRRPRGHRGCCERSATC